MDSKQLKRVFGLLSFLTALITYSLTVQGSVPFWDCSEFSSAAILQQVPHPPGAPLFLMIGKLFDILIPFGDPGWKINMVSALSSAVVIWLLFEITVMVIKNLNKEPLKDFGSQLATYGSAFVGAAAFTFSDTFWFNAVESEVYAMSSLFVAIVIYLMMKWNENADKPGHERYLLLIAYLIGLSTGVHLLAVLCIPPVTYMVYFRKYKFEMKSFIITTIIAGVMFYLVYPVIVKWIPALLAGHTPFRSEAKEYFIEGSAFLSNIVLLVILSSAGLLYWSYKKKNRILSLVTTSFLLIIIGYTTYTQILIRSNSHPPMNENYPANFTKLSSYLGREQYGDDPAWPRRVKTEERFTRRYQQKNADGEYRYGPWHQPGRKSVYRKSGEGFTMADWSGRSLFKTPELFWGEINYLMKFQINHMYMRYFFWNFSGRNSDKQDAGWNMLGETTQADILNKDSGYKDLFPITFFFLPVLFGLIGMYYHASKNPKTFAVYLLLFLLLGVLAAVAQQQQDPQPRERDYFYTGSFMIWAMWIGMGVFGIIKTINITTPNLKDKSRQLSAGFVLGVIIVSTLLVPSIMAYEGWDYHDRTGNFIPFDYSYNILQSAEQDALIFTNGDNDTFPVWYIQDVMGVRRDVRIVNLSLGNTLWYVNQMKHDRPWGAKKLPLTFSDASLQVDDELDPIALTHLPVRENKHLSIPVKREILEQYTNDSTLLARGTFEADIPARTFGNGVLYYRVQDQLVMDILEQTKWERPVYFSTTVGPDAFIGLQKFFRVEGMCMRICPVEQERNSISMEVMEQCLMNIDNTENFSKEFKYGFKLRNLNNRDVYFDPVHRGLTRTYRELYTTYASQLIDKKNDKERAVEVLDKMNEMISIEQFPLTFFEAMEISNFYKKIGNKEKEAEFNEYVLKSCNDIINEKSQYSLAYREVTEGFMGPYRIAGEIYMNKKDYTGARKLYMRMLQFADGIFAATPQIKENYPILQKVNVTQVDAQLNLYIVDVEEMLSQNKKDEAISYLDNLLDKYKKSAQEDPGAQYINRGLFMKKLEIESEYRKSEASETDSITELSRN